MENNKARRPGRSRGGKRQAAKRLLKQAWQSPKIVAVYASRNEAEHLICEVDTGEVDLETAQAHAVDMVWTPQLTAKGFKPVTRWNRPSLPALLTR